MNTSDAIVKLAKLLAAAYAEAVGPRRPKKGRKKLKREDHPRHFDRLAELLMELRLATALTSTPACPNGTIWCVLPPPLGSRCMTLHDCIVIGGDELLPDKDKKP